MKYCWLVGAIIWGTLFVIAMINNYIVQFLSSNPDTPLLTAGTLANGALYEVECIKNRLTKIESKS